MLDRLSPALVSAPKKPLGSPDISRREEVKNTTQEGLLALQFDMAIGRLSQNLRSSYSTKHIEFDMASFEKRMREAILKVRDNHDIPLIAKKKFLRDIISKTDILSSITEQNILDLRKSRTEDSLGQEASELEIKFGKGVQAESRVKGFYLGKILDKTIGEYIEPVAYSLQASFSDEKTQIGTYEFHRENLEKFSSKLQELDAAYGLDISSEIRTFTKKRLERGLGDLAREDLYREMGQRIVLALHKQHSIADGKRVIELIQNGNLTTRAKNGRFTETTLANGSRADIVDIVLAYKKEITTFQGTEREVRETGIIALSDDVIASTKRILGMEELKSEFDYLEPEDIEKKIKESSLSDLIIIIGQLAQLPPVFGDILSGAIEGRDMVRGITSEGKLLSSTDRVICSVFAVLGITVVAGTVSKLMKSKKFITLLKSFSLAKKHLPGKLSSFIKTGGVLSEQTKRMLEKTFPVLEPAYLLGGSENRVMKEGQIGSKAHKTETLSESGKVVREIEYILDGKNIVIKNIYGTSEAAVRRELSAILEKTHADTISFDPHMDMVHKRILANILAKNHPLIEVLRLLPGNNVVNVSFAGIKKLNDIYGQAFVDKLLALSKNRMMQSVNTYVKQGSEGAEHIRLVRDDYKNLTLSLPPNIEEKSLLFKDIKTKEAFIREIIAGMHKEIEVLAREKNVSLERVAKDILSHWSFSVGKSRVETGSKGEQKLHAFAEAELVSRDGIVEKGISIGTFDVSRSVRFGQECVRQEVGIIEKWEGKTFIFENISYPIIMHITEHKRIHPELLRQVRKHGTGIHINPPELAKEVKKYIDTLNAGFDFIPPSHNLDKDLLAAQKMSEDFGKGKIEAKSLLTNFKGVMTKEAFIESIGDKPGMRLFIDIKDMGLQNLQSFQFLSRKAASLQSSARDAFSAGKEVTDNFIVLIKKIRESYPGAQITLGGDEIYIFLPGMTRKKSLQALKSIHEKLETSHLEGRVSSSFEIPKTEEVFKKLDESTSLHKMVEKMLRDGRTIGEQSHMTRHETISLELGQGVAESDIAGLLGNPMLRRALERALQGLVDEKGVRSRKIGLSGVGELNVWHDDGILHFIFTKKS